MAKNNQKAIIHQQRNSYKTYSKAYDALYAMLLADEKINYYTVAEKAGVSRSYLYQHNGLSTMIQQFSILQKQELSANKLKEDYEKARKRLEEAQKRYKEVKEEYNKL